MVKETLETKARKSVVKIEQKIDSTNNLLRDICMKLCHLIKHRRDYYVSNGAGYDNPHNKYSHDSQDSYED